MGYSKKVLSHISRPKACGTFSPDEAKAKELRLAICSTGEFKQGAKVTFFLLVDEEDGVIADAKFQIFAPPLLLAAADCLCSLLLRKNYLQAQRVSAELIEKELGSSVPQINLLIEAIDKVVEKCMDIPIEDTYVTPPEMAGGERTEYPNWEGLSDGQKKSVIDEVIKRDIRPYVELDAGGVEVAKVEENRVTITYSGNCTTCYSATGTTLDAIGNILRHKIYPDLMVIPDSTLLR